MVQPILGAREKTEEEVQCKKYACAFQFCLNRYALDMEKCRPVYDEYEQCAASVRARSHAADTTTSAHETRTKAAIEQQSKYEWNGKR